ncbi:hypothetical protein D1B31_03625 [Neobacillus notoginsengisoli]|uniref:Uncharacterized protein n=1 Tax=Neobacillus notoginsengisoli TaxID=1578198 RepID=A0A417YYU0_9BACI|nr:hypothetical protein [Neobacillus notoginsengisoli]RHW42690.1 hypothetical protein D1B31_03625 [Neobacillus notoginsengisoli]
MKNVLRIIFTILFYVLIFPITVLIIVVGPLMSFTDLIDVFKYEAPRTVFPIPMIICFGFILFLSMQFEPLRWIYKKVPVLLPFLQMCFIMFLVLEIGVEFANLWADHGMIPRTAAIILSILTVVLGRAFLSYWYYKYPISFKVQKEK